MQYVITNTSALGKSFMADNGKRISFRPGERKELSSLPPGASENDLEAKGWKIEQKEKNEEETKADNEEDGGDN